MTDYTKATGNAGTMMIRDTGTTVEFWLRAGSSTFNHDLPWAYTINNAASSWREFDFQSGGDWQRLGSWNITYNQTVVFRLGDSNTSGLGGPTNFSRAIVRSTIPSAPGAVTFSSVKQTSLTASFKANYNGGSPILQYQIGYGTSSSSPTIFVTSDGSTTITGLTPVTTYYFWARARNQHGWSAWSSVRSVKTVGGVRIKVGTTYKTAIPYVRDGGVWKLARPWGRIAGVWKEST